MSATPITGPYTHEKSSISRTMIWVMLALTPATAWGIYQFGLPALWLFIITIAACLISEAVCLYIAGKPIKPFLANGSAILTGWLLAMTLPPWAPWWIGVFDQFSGATITPRAVVKAIREDLQMFNQHRAELLTLAAAGKESATQKPAEPKASTAADANRQAATNTAEKQSNE